MARLSIRIDLAREGRIGPGKVALLERVAELGSISAAGRAMGMSYKRAWQLVAELNRAFGQPLVEARPGGVSGGGAKLTPFGEEIVFRYRAVEEAAEGAVAMHLAALEALSNVRSEPDA